MIMSLRIALFGTLTTLFCLLTLTPIQAQNLGNNPLMGGLVGAGVGGGLGTALGGEKGAKTGAIIGGVGGALQGMQSQRQSGYGQSSNILQQDNPLAGGLVGAGIGGGLGAALGGEKGAKTGAIIGGVGGALQGMQSQRQPRQPYQHYRPQPAYPAYQPAPAYQAPVAYRPVPSQFIVNIQTALTNLGYKPGAPDGLMGPATREAVRAYQSNYGLKITGEPTPELLAHMRKMGG